MQVPSTRHEALARLGHPEYAHVRVQRFEHNVVVDTGQGQPAYQEAVKTLSKAASDC